METHQQHAATAAARQLHAYVIEGSWYMGIVVAADEKDALELSRQGGPGELGWEEMGCEPSKVIIREVDLTTPGLVGSHTG